ncbi:hypothetical protein PSMA108079_09435 [Pseudoalteromonas mariniglutinosa]
MRASTLIDKLGDAMFDYMSFLTLIITLAFKCAYYREGILLKRQIRKKLQQDLIKK